MRGGRGLGLGLESKQVEDASVLVLVGFGDAIQADTAFDGCESGLAKATRLVGVGAVIHEVMNDFDMAVACGRMEGRISVRGPAVDRDFLLFNEILYDRKLPIEGSVGKGVQPNVRGMIKGTLLNQVNCDLKMTSIGGCADGDRANLVGEIEVGAAFDQQFDDFEPARGGGDQKEGLAPLTRRGIG